MKKGPAIIAALITALVIGVGILVIGVNAFFNPNQAPVLSTSTDTNVSSIPSGAPLVQQLQERIAQYQAREQQYQDQLNAVQQQLGQASQEVGQYQQLLTELQERGVIQIDERGQVFLPRAFEREHEDDDD